jgi:hypothetical protein
VNGIEKRIAGKEIRPEEEMKIGDFKWAKCR